MNCKFYTLCAHFGQYRENYKELHYHPCHNEGCKRVLIGKGWWCDGDMASHHRETLK